MRREVLAAAGNAAATAPRKKADSGLYKTAMITFFAVYMVGQCVVLLTDSSTPSPTSSVVRNAVRFSKTAPSGAWDSILSAGRTAPDAGVVAESVAPGDAGAASAARALPATDRTHTKGWVAAVGNDFSARVTDGGAAFQWSSLDAEPAYPPMVGHEDATPILASRPALKSVGAAWEEEARAIKTRASEAARVKGEDPEAAAHDAPLPPRGRQHVYDSMSVTIGHPCWSSSRLLYAMGLDRMAVDLADEPPPRDLQRSKLDHALAPLANDLFCTFHSTPIQGGLQCCCTSNLTVDAVLGGATAPPAEAPAEGGTFFCMPTMSFVGARNTGVGRLYALFHQHAYMVTAPAPPPHAFAAVTNRMVVDGVMPRYAGHYANQMPAKWRKLPTFAERNKAVSSSFWVDPSPSYFYGINVRVAGARSEARASRGAQRLSLIHI